MTEATTEKFADELEPGDRYESLEFVVTPELNQQMLFAQEDFDTRYIEARDSHPPIVHPAVLMQMSANTKSPSFRLKPKTGSILGEEVIEYLGTAYLDRKLRVEWEVVKAYEKRGRNYYVMEARITDADGAQILKRELHLTFFQQ